MVVLRLSEHGDVIKIERRLVEIIGNFRGRGPQKFSAQGPQIAKTTTAYLRHSSQLFFPGKEIKNIIVNVYHSLYQPPLACCSHSGFLRQTSSKPGNDHKN